MRTSRSSSETNSEMRSLIWVSIAVGIEEKPGNGVRENWGVSLTRRAKEGDTDALSITHSAVAVRALSGFLRDFNSDGAEELSSDLGHGKPVEERRSLKRPELKELQVASRPATKRSPA